MDEDKECVELTNGAHGHEHLQGYVAAVAA